MEDSGGVSLLCVGEHDYVYRAGVFYALITALVRQEFPVEGLGDFAMFRQHSDDWRRGLISDLRGVLDGVDVSPEDIATFIIGSSD
jgi:hypothetical protein